MEDKLYYFTFRDSFTKRIENLEVKAKTFAEALPRAYIYRQSLNRQYKKANWDVIDMKSKNIPT
tara:strand:+ start:707 stop:898 length:192 start_codon:yes stop_codon:yes gene_type:complete